MESMGEGWLQADHDIFRHKKESEEQHDIALYRPGKMQAEDAQEIVEADIQISKTAYIK